MNFKKISGLLLCALVFSSISLSSLAASGTKQPPAPAIEEPSLLTKVLALFD